MGKYSVEVEKKAKEELLAHKKAGNKVTIHKIEKIIVELSDTPYNGTGSPEALKHELSGYWSRRINVKDRLLYRVEGKRVIIVSAYGHYNDK